MKRSHVSLQSPLLWLTRTGLCGTVMASMLWMAPSAFAHPGDRHGVEGPQSRFQSITREDRVERRLRRLSQRLELTEDQQTLVRAILERHIPTRAAVEGLTREERRALRGDIRAAVRDELEEVLTPDQLDRLDTLRRRHGRFGERLLHLADLLELSDAQRDALRPVFEELRNKHRALHHEEEDPQARRQARRALRQELRAALESVLTEDQLDRLRAHRQERREMRRERREMRHSR